MKLVLGLILSLLICQKTYSFTPKGELWEDTKTSFEFLYMGGLQQFRTKSNLYYSLAAVPSLWYAFENDDRIVDLAASKDIAVHEKAMGQLGIVFNFPILPLTAYYIGRHRQDNKMMLFAMEYAATLYLAQFQTVLISHINIHQRPDATSASFWETAFRGNSSFPSGHVMPFMVLTLKTFQYYGPWWAIPPAIASYWSGFQRINDRKHHFSDVVGALFLTIFSSEGVRAYVKNDTNHPVYKYIFEHDLRVGFVSDDRSKYAQVSFSF